MKQLILVIKKLNEETGEFEADREVQLKINDTPIQVREFMDTETYFAVTMLTDEKPAKQMKIQGYFMMKQLIINPKINDELINKLPWDLSFKIMKALREEFLSEESFLELGVPLDSLSQEKENIESD